MKMMMMHGCGSGCTHMAVGLYALLAALGYWIMQHSAKETANCVKRAGQILSWTFIVIGMMGILCGVASHVKNMCHKSCRCGAEMMEQREMGEVGDMERNIEVRVKSNCPMKGEMMKKDEMVKKGEMKKPEAAPKKK